MIKVAGNPQPCVGTTKRVRKGPPVPVVIWRPCPMVPAEYWLHDPEEWCRPLDRYPRLQAKIGEREVDPDDAWEQVRFVAFRDWLYLVEMRAWAKTHDPTHSLAQERTAVDLATAPVVSIV